jgi:hypothetical protein
VASNEITPTPILNGAGDMLCQTAIRKSHRVLLDRLLDKEDGGDQLMSDTKSR